jgi:uncharacterized protein (TIGR03435 family)
MRTERYDIIANVPERTTEDQARLMLQNLLMARLHLVFHFQTNAVPGYQLAVAASGSKLKESIAADLTAPEPLREPDVAVSPETDKNGFPILPPGVRQATLFGQGEHLLSTFSNTSMPEFASFLGPRLGTEMAAGALSDSIRSVPASVLDKTGLTGRYDFTIEFDSWIPGFNLSRAQSALEKQLGLILVKATNSVDVLVIDHVEKVPAEN